MRTILSSTPGSSASEVKAGPYTESVFAKSGCSKHEVGIENIVSPSSAVPQIFDLATSFREHESSANWSLSTEPPLDWTQARSLRNARISSPKILS